MWRGEGRFRMKAAIILICCLALLPLGSTGVIGQQHEEKPAQVPATLPLPTGPITSFSAAAELTTEGHWEQLPLEVGIINSLAIDPSNSQTLYIGTYGDVFKSTNGGASWSVSSTGLTRSTMNCLAIDPSNSQILYVGTDVGDVFKSTNGGASWSSSSSGLTGSYMWSLAIDFSNPQTLYAGTNGGGAFKSTNGGASWSSSSSGLPTNSIVLCLAIDPYSPQTLYAGFWGGVFKSNNGGVVWGDSSSGLPWMYVHCLAIDRDNSQILYAGPYGGGVYKSTDGGASWTASSSGLTNGVMWSLVINPSNPQTLYAGTDGGAFTSTDGGASWTAFSTGLTDSRVRCLVIDPSNPQILYAGTYGGGMWKWNPSSASSLSLTSPKGGENWPLSSTQTITWTSTNLSGNLAITLSRDGGSTYTETLAASAPVSTGSFTWTVSSPPSTACRVKIASLTDPTHFAASGSDFTIQPSSNNWLQLFPTNSPPTRCDFAMTYAPNVGKIILFGGMNPTASQDTWAYDPLTNNWQALAPSGNIPSPRFAHSMVYAPSVGKVILFGGWNWNSGSLADTWAYDPVSNVWQNMNPPHAPSPRYTHNMVYMDNVGKVILFGGSPSSALLNDTWAYDPIQNDWTNLTPSNPPPERAHLRMAYDKKNGQVVLFGGANGSGWFNGLNDTWLFNYSTNNWIQLHPVISPSPRAGHNMCWVGSANAIILFGGHSDPNDTSLNDTWLFNTDSNEWLNLNPSNLPPARELAGLVSAGDSGRVILFGGSNYSSSSYFNDTWELSLGSASSIPRFTNLPATRVVPTGAPFSFTAEATADGGGSLFFSLVSGACSGMTINSNTGMINWPTPQEGYYQIQVGVSNGFKTVTSGLTLDVPGEGPGKPENLTATSSNGSVLLNWSPALPGNTPLAGYYLYRGTAAGGENRWPLNNQPVTGTSYLDTNLENGQPYYYKVRAVDQAMPTNLGAPSNEAFATPRTIAQAPPGKILQLDAIPGNGVVALTWRAASVGSTPLAGYHIYRSLHSGVDYTLLSSVGTMILSFADATAQNGIPYYYQVAAFDNSTPPLEGGYSLEVQATPSANPIMPPHVIGQSPSPGASGISRSASISATFDQAMDRNWINGTTIFLVKSTSRVSVEGMISYDPSSHKASFALSSPLEPNTTYQATAKGGYQGFRSQTGIPLAADVSWTFTTAQSQGLPDLYLSSSDISVTGSGASTQIRAIIHNAGPGSVSNVQVRFHQGATLDQTITLLGAFSSGTTREAILAASLQSDIPLVITIDPSELIAEEDRNNNQASFQSRKSGDPVVQQLTADFERAFMPGVKVANTIHAQVLANPTDPVAFVRFSLSTANGTHEQTDLDPTSGWSGTFNMGDLTPGANLLTVVAVSQTGRRSLPKTMCLMGFRYHDPLIQEIIQKLGYVAFTPEPDLTNHLVRYSLGSVQFAAGASEHLDTRFLKGSYGVDLGFELSLWIDSLGAGGGSISINPEANLILKSVKPSLGLQPKVSIALSADRDFSVSIAAINFSFQVNLSASWDIPTPLSLVLPIPFIKPKPSLGFVISLTLGMKGSLESTLRPSNENRLVSWLPLAFDGGTGEVTFFGSAALAFSAIVARVEGGGRPEGTVTFQLRPFRAKKLSFDLHLFIKTYVMFWGEWTYDLPVSWFHWEKSLSGQGGSFPHTSALSLPSYSVVDRDYLLINQPLASMSSAFGGEFPPEFAIWNNVIPRSHPNLVSSPTGSAWLLFNTDDPSKSQPSCYKIASSTWSGTSWTAPQLVEDSLFPQYDAKMVYTPSGPLALWTVVPSATLTPSDAPETIFPLVDLAWSSWNGTGWNPPAMLTEDGSFTFDPVLVSAPDSSAWAAWLTNTTTDLNPSGQSIHFAHYQGGTWTASGVVTPSTAYVGGGLALTVSGTRPLLCWVEDTNGDPSTIFDQEMVWSIYNGNSWSAPIVLAGNSDLEQSPASLRASNGSNWLAYVQTPTFTETDTPLPSRLVVQRWDGNIWSSPMTVVSSYSLANPSWLEDSQGNLFLAWDGYDEQGQQRPFFAFQVSGTNTWSTPRPLTSMPGNYSQKTLALLPGDQVMTADVRQNVTETPSGPIDSTSDLCVHFLPLAANPVLVPGSLTLSPSQPLPGQEVTATASVMNTGTRPTEGVRVALYDGDPMAGGLLLAGPVPLTPIALFPDQITTVSCTFLCPDDLRSHAVFLTLSTGNAGGSGESQASDRATLQTEESGSSILQSASVPFLLPDVQFTDPCLQVTSQGSMIRLEATFTNTGWGASPTLPVRVYDGDPAQGAPLLAENILPSLTPSETTSLSWSWTPSSLPLGVHYFWVELDPEKTVLQQASQDSTRTAMAMAALGPDLHPVQEPLALSTNLAGPVEVLLTLENQGLGTQNVPIALYDTDPTQTTTTPSGEVLAPTPLVWQVLLEVPGTSTVVVSLPYQAQVGSCTLYAWVDPQNQILDIDSSDHLVTLSTTFLPPGSLNVSFSLQGATTSYTATFAVSLHEPGGTSPLFSSTVTSPAQVGSFTVVGVTAGSYDIKIKEGRALSTWRTGVALSSGTTTVAFGEQRVGDANDDDVINIMDFAILKGAIFTWEGQPGFDPRADFNGDGVVNIMDFALMKSNFGRYGPL